LQFRLQGYNTRNMYFTRVASFAGNKTPGKEKPQTVATAENIANPSLLATPALQRMADRLRQLEESTHQKTANEIGREEILKALDTLGSHTVGEDGLIYEGERIILPAAMEGNLQEVLTFLTDVRVAEEQEYAYNRTFQYRPWDGANAFRLAMLRVFGTEGIGQAVHTFFGKRPPEYHTIAVDFDKQVQVPWGRITFSPLDATMHLGSENRADGPLFTVTVKAPRKHRRRIEGFLDVVEDELKKHSIYRGKAIDAALNPGFVNVKAIDPARVVYAQHVYEQLEANLWSVLRYGQRMRELGISLKRAVLLEGPYGTGKTLAGALTAQHAIANGWTFILVKPGEDPYAALRTARLYAPAVVWIEDLDVLSAGKDRDEITGLLDALDGVQAKGAEVVAGFTTNFASTIDRGVLRPGRIDAVISVKDLDRPGLEKLIKSLIPAEHLGVVDFDSVATAMQGFLPAFVAEAAQRSVRYSMARNAGEPGVIVTRDLLQAAEGLRDQLNLVNDAGEAQHKHITMERLFARQVESVLARVEIDGERLEVAAG
jgi:ATPase family associated with various cellular activities (AAA)